MEGFAEPLLKPHSARPKALRQRSQSAVTKPSILPDVTAADSDASKRSSRHRHTQSHHHIPHHPKRFVKDRLGQLQNGAVGSLAELSKQTSRISNAPVQDGAAGGSRKGSSAVDGAITSSTGAMNSEDTERLVLEEQWKNQKRQNELQKTLHNLSEESMKTTRRLDDLYYNLLEKLAGLVSTINNLQELAGLTARLHGQFREETSELSNDLHRQIESFGGFRAQQVQLEAVDKRVKDSKRKADKLSERMEAARKRVSALEVKEKEWQDSVNYRLRWMWSIIAIIAGMLLAFCGTCVYNAMSYGQSPNSEVAKLSLASLTSVPTSVKIEIESVIGQSINTTSIWSSTPSAQVSTSSKISKVLETTTPADRDPLLRIFDELY